MRGKSTAGIAQEPATIINTIKLPVRKILTEPNLSSHVAPAL